MEKDFKFLDIENISEEELIHIGGTLIFKLGEVENFGELMSLYFQEGFLPFVKTPEELYNYISFVGENYISALLLENRPIKIEGLIKNKKDLEKRLEIERNSILLVIGKICLVFLSLGTLNYNFTNVPLLINTAHNKFNLKKKTMISVSAEMFAYSFMVYTQLDKAGKIRHNKKEDNSKSTEN